MRIRLLPVFLLLTMPSVSLPAQQGKVDHSAFDRLLRQHVVNGLVDYDAFARDSSFTRYLQAMEQVDPSVLSSEERVAYWINMYNAWTIRLITMNGERESIRNINRTLGILRLKGPWIQPVVRARQHTLSLDQVQHDMIRRESTDPRIHFALSCGAKSCAPLRSEAYTGENLEVQLQDQGSVFLADTSRNRVDVNDGVFHRNVVFRYFQDDFGETRREIGSFLAQWYNDTTTIRIERPEVAMMRKMRDTSRLKAIAGDSTDRYIVTSQVKMLQSGRFRYIDMPFDWSLNTLPRTTSAQKR